jgi:predicted PurR-regulated permease PerM
MSATRERRDRQGMPPWVPRLLVMIVLIVVGLFSAYHMLRQLRGLLVIIGMSLFLSIALEPGVNFLARKGWRRGLATGLMFVGLVAVVGLVIGLMVPLIVDQITNLIVNLPDYLDQAARFLARFGLDFSSARVAEAVQNIDTSLTRFAADVAGNVFGVGQALLSTVFQMLTIALFTFYMTAEGPKFRRTVCSVLPRDRQIEVLKVWEIAIDKTGAYFYSRTLLAGFAAAVGWAVFTVVGVPYALALALWMAVLSQFVPVVGTYLGGALPLLIALLESAGTAVAVLVYVIVYQQIENYLLAPKITARTMALHPAVAFGSVIIGGSLLGVPGTLMALPVAATIQAFVTTYVERHQVVESPLTEDPPPRAAKSGQPKPDPAEGLTPG